MRRGLVGRMHLGAPLTGEEGQKLLSLFWYSIRQARHWLRHADSYYKEGDWNLCCILTMWADREYRHAEAYFNALLMLAGRRTLERQGIYDELTDELAEVGSEIDARNTRCKCFAAWEQL